MKKKALAMLLACVMLMGVAIGGSLAWLTDKTEEVKNVFTDSDISITLDESVDTDVIGEESFKMIPGHTITKDPEVTVKAGSEACWLFVKVAKKGGVVTYTPTGGTETTTSWDDFLSYEIAVNNVSKDNVWTQLPAGEAGVLQSGETVYYIAVEDLSAEGATDKSYGILAGGEHVSEGVSYTWEPNQVLIKPEVTKEMMNALKADPDEYPTLTFTAYATQYYKTGNTEAEAFGYAEAWQKTAGYVEPTTP